MGSAQLTFDAENRIVQAYDTVAQNSTCFGYDALGERVYKQTFGGSSCAGTAATTVIYVYDAFGNLMRQVETVTGSGTLPPTPCLTCYLKRGNRSAGTRLDPQAEDTMSLAERTGFAR